MKIALITGAGGLIGGQAVEFFVTKFDLVVGIDNDMRRYFFGQQASTDWNRLRLQKMFANYRHYSADIRDLDALQRIFQEFGADLGLVVHAAGQPSHDWAAREPFTDFSVNATGTLNLLEMTRLHAPEAVFVFTSTNKVYGDHPNHLPLVELETRWEIDATHPYYARGIDEQLSIDHTAHSLFGASKVAADVLVQEYGRSFGLKTAVFRSGCLTGPRHAGVQQHGFLSYLMKCAINGEHYTVLGYQGKQVRDNIHAYDLVNMFWNFYQRPRSGGLVYNAGGSRFANCSMQEAIALCETITGNKLNCSYSAQNRVGDHIWYVSDVSRFEQHYPDWRFTYDLTATLTQMFDELRERQAP